MVPESRGATRLVRVAFGLLVFAGCGSSAPLERAGVEFTPPAGWKSTPADTWAVPGKPLAAWSGPDRSSVVLYQSLPIPGAKAESVAEGLANRLTNLPGVTVLKRETEPVAGLTAARVEAVGQGTGDCFAPSGAGKPVALKGATLTPTRRVVVVIPRAADTLTLVWHAPEASAPALSAQIRSALASLRIDGNRLATSTY